MDGTRMEVDAEGNSDHEGGVGMAATHGFMREVAVALKEVVSELRVLNGQSYYNHTKETFAEVATKKRRRVLQVSSDRP